MQLAVIWRAVTSFLVLTRRRQNLRSSEAACTKFMRCARRSASMIGFRKLWHALSAVRKKVARGLVDESATKHLEEHRDRVAGTLLGLAIGDSNGGPTEMALRICESMLEKGHFDADDVFERYMDWFRAGSYDTGPVAAGVFALVEAGP